MLRRAGSIVAIPPDAGLDELRRRAAHCRGCDLYRRATQTVFGEGAPGAPIVLVGEQPGDREDLEGRPFVGPAGRLLDRALVDAGIDRDAVYVTNAVKHFKWVERGKRRIHEKPNGRERDACHPWLDAEIRAVAPGLVVCLGATAAQSMLGASFRLTRHRGEFLQSNGVAVMATIHPSALLRVHSAEEREAGYHGLVADLRRARKRARTPVRAPTLPTGRGA